MVLLRQAKLLFQIFDQLLEALRGDGVIAQGSRPLGCSKRRSSSFRSLFSIMATHSSQLRRRSGTIVHSFSASFFLEAERANLPVKLPKLNVAIDN